MIHVILALVRDWKQTCTPYTRILAHGRKALGQNDNLLTRDIVFFDRLADDHLGRAIGVPVGGVPSIDAHIVRCFEDR